MNRYGLPRYIPQDVRREVRQRCGYGCVLCGVGIIDYHHVDPPFAEAKSHDPAGIAILCVQHHGEVTRGFIANETVKRAMADPAGRRAGYANAFFDIGRTHPKLVLAGMTIEECFVPLIVDDARLFRIEQAEPGGGPFRLSGDFYGSESARTLSIVENEWRSATANWDVEVAGGAITIRRTPRHVVLRLRALPPDGLAVEHLDMAYRGYRMTGNERTLTAEMPSGRRIDYTGCLASRCEVGLVIREGRAGRLLRPPPPS